MNSGSSSNGSNVKRNLCLPVKQNEIRWLTTLYKSIIIIIITITGIRQRGEPDHSHLKTELFFRAYGIDSP